MDVRHELLRETAVPTLINNPESLSRAAMELAEQEMLCPVEVSIDQSLRLKVLDQCGMACTFCHNEGTPVSADNTTQTAGNFVSSGKSNRVSIYLDTNGADFVSGTVQPDEALASSVDRLQSAVYFDEIHLTGGEPTLHPNLDSVISDLTAKGMKVKITSNGERFYAIAPQLKKAGLSKVVFSIFGTTPEELAAVQGSKFNNPKFAELKLNALKRSIEAAAEQGIPASANIVMPSAEHGERIKGVIEEFGDKCKIRILNSLEEGAESYAAIYELLASLGAVPKQVNLTAGASGMSVDYTLPDGKEIGFKQIRKSYLKDECGGCSLKNNGCEEGYYGMRMYVGRDNKYRVGVCIQRMDLTKPLDEFLESDLPDGINQHRIDEYNSLSAGVQ